MMADRRENQRPSQVLDRAFRAGDIDALRAALGDPADFPNCQLPAAFGYTPLAYALYWSPPDFIKALLQLGADPNYEGDDGFPSLIAVLSTDRNDRYTLVELLINAGTEINQRGLNDWTPLHYAVSQRDLKAVQLLLKHGADPTLRTRIDDLTTALEEAGAIDFADALEPLRQAMSQWEATGR